MPDWNALRKEIPACEKFTFLNSAGRGPVCRKAAEAGRSYYDESLAYGNTPWDQWLEKIEVIRAHTAEFIKAKEREIAFVPNSSCGLNYIASILGNIGDVLMCSDEFPSSSLPWLQQGYNVKFISSDKSILSVDRIISEIDEKTKVIVTSHVQYSTGYRQDLERLGDFCREKGIVFVVDATQSAGVVPLDVKACKIDFMVFSAYKWMNAGCGLAVLYMSEKFLEPENFPATGWRSARVPYSMINDSLDIVEAAKALELGHPQFPNILAFGGALEFINQIGLAAIWDRVQQLTDEFHAKLNDARIPIISPTQRGCRAGITMISAENAKEVVARLKEQNVIVAARGEGYVCR